MFFDSKLKKGLKKALKCDDGKLSRVLEKVGNEEISSVSEAELLVQVMKRLPCPKDPERFIGSPESDIASLWQGTEDEKAREVLKKFGGQELLRIFDDALAELPSEEDSSDKDLPFLLKVICLYVPEGGEERVVTAARHPVLCDAFLWSVIFSVLEQDDHPYASFVFEQIKSSLPQKFAGVAFLDFSNTQAREKGVVPHPFDTEEGAERLRNWLEDPDEENFSYAHSSAAAIPFLSESLRSELLPVALEHPSADVRLEAAWAAAKGGDESGFQVLQKACADPNQFSAAERYLVELGAEERVPLTAKQPDFRALAEMCQWLAHPQEFGRPPEHIECVDSRKLFWPPTGDERDVWVFKYRYPADEEGDDPDIGHGMVGSVTFALFGETTAELSSEDVYALHCCWELEMNEDASAPAERSVSAGRAILREHNVGF